MNSTKKNTIVNYDGIAKNLLDTMDDESLILFINFTFSRKFETNAVVSRMATETSTVSAHLSCHPEVNVFCQGRDSILSTELEKQTDTPSTEVSISI